MTLLHTLLFARSLRKRAWNSAEVALVTMPITWLVIALLFVGYWLFSLVL